MNEFIKSINMIKAYTYVNKSICMYIFSMRHIINFDKTTHLTHSRYLVNRRWISKRDDRSKLLLSIIIYVFLLLYRDAAGETSENDIYSCRGNFDVK